MQENDLLLLKKFVRLCRETVSKYVSSTYGTHITKDDVNITCAHIDPQNTSMAAKVSSCDDIRFELVFYGRDTEFKLFAYKENDSVTYNASPEEVEYLRIITEQE